MSVQTEHLDAEVLEAIQGVLEHYLPDSDHTWLNLAAQRRLYGEDAELTERMASSCDAMLAHAEVVKVVTQQDQVARNNLIAASTGHPGIYISPRPI